jgi:hypothetical protein
MSQTRKIMAMPMSMAITAVNIQAIGMSYRRLLTDNEAFTLAVVVHEEDQEEEGDKD